MYKITVKKNGKEVLKCDVILTDHSYTEISLTLWGNSAEKAKNLFLNQPIVAIRRALISEYNSSLSLRLEITGGGIEINPFFLPKAKQLHTWWVSKINAVGVVPTRNLSQNNTRLQPNFDTIEERMDIAAIKEYNIDAQDKEKPDYIIIKGYCTFIYRGKQNIPWYTACPNSDDPCRNLYKVTQCIDETWECIKCCKRYPKPLRRWLFSAIVEDHSSSTWVTLYNEQAEKLLGDITAEYAFNMTNCEDGTIDNEKLNEILFQPLYQEYIFKCKIKNEINQETNEYRLKTIIVSLAPIDYLKETLQLLTLLEE